MQIAAVRVLNIVCAKRPLDLRSNLDMFFFTAATTTTDGTGSPGLRAAAADSVSAPQTSVT